jgi:undecaprenyl diphosphate synthase
VGKDLLHVGIIMDGNRRWAKKNNLPIKSGHEAGYENFKKIVKFASSLDIKFLTVYAFSTENWSRPKDQVDELIELMDKISQTNFSELKEQNASVRILGDLSRYPKVIQSRIKKAVKETKKNSGIVVNIALSYGGRDEIVRAVNKIVSKGEEINELAINSNLDTASIPEPDIILRTGGVKRLSNFLCWQGTYSELFFVDTLWPDFTEAQFLEIIEDYKLRERRYGK